MKVDVVKLTDSYGEFVMTDVTPSFLNSLRRMLLSDVPKLAFDHITIYDNTSALFDEMLAHRIGLLPVPTDLTMVVPRAECTCEDEGCANCTVLYTLSKEGPGMVLSGDFVPAADAKYRIVDPKIPLVKLLEGQRVMLECAATLGTGRQHAKWQVCNAVGYNEYPIIKLGDSPLPPAVVERVSRTAPEDAIRVEDGKLKILDPVKASVYLRSVKKTYGLDEVEVSYETNRWIFRMETDGALAPLVALRKAVNLLMERLKEVEAEIPKLKEIEEATV